MSVDQIIRLDGVGLCCFLLGAMIAFAPSQSPAQKIELIGETTVESRTLTFAEGQSTRFSRTANGRTHQQTSLTTYGGFQYVTYFDAKRRVCIGRRKLPSGAWEVIHFDDHKFESNDSHNTAVLGICDKDGTIHMAFDHHASRLNYRVSELEAAHHPESVEWNAELFSPIKHTLGSVVPDDQVTYPRFFPASNGNLMFYYRAVTSGNGDGMIEEYDGNKHDWTAGLGKFIARDIGTYKANGKTSLYRNPYMNSLSYAGQRLHASWVWRDRFEKTNVRNQHDLCYAYSNDHGRTWHNSAGKLIGKTGRDPIHLNSPGLVVAPIPTNHGLTNSNTHYAYADGSVHVLMRHFLEGTKKSNYQHYWRTSEGTWHREVLPLTGDRPKIIGSQARTLVLVYSCEGELLVATGRPRRNDNGWRWKSLNLPHRHSNYGDAVLDLRRWESDKILSVYSQAEPVTEIRTTQSGPVDGIPSPLRVVDYRITETITLPASVEVNQTQQEPQ